MTSPGEKLLKAIVDFKDKNQYIPSLERDYSPIFKAMEEFEQETEKQRKDNRDRIINQP